MNRVGRLYDFVFRGLLAEEALDSLGRKTQLFAQEEEAETARILSVGLLDDAHVVAARGMAPVYVAIAAFENGVRQLISSVLLEAEGEGWWDKCVSDKVRQRAEGKRKEEEKVRWHVQRGADPIFYTQMPDLTNILRQNWTHFQPYVPSIEWADGILDVIERSRNVIMHSGVLGKADVERLGIYIRDWIKQVGT